MNQTKEMLLAMKHVVDLDDDYYYILSINKDKKIEGVASFYPKSNEKIKVYEGNGDGSDDHDIMIDEFIQKYEFRLERY